MTTETEYPINTEQLEQNLTESQNQPHGKDDYKENVIELIKKFNNKLLELEEENKALNDKYLRTYSDFENYKKRIVKEKEDLLFNTNRNIFNKLLPTLDDIERVLGSNIIDSEGLNIIHNSFLKTLKDNGLEKIDTLNTLFNADIHEAITIIDNGPEKSGIVIQELQTGYKFNNKLIRPSKVVVGS